MVKKIVRSFLLSLFGLVILVLLYFLAPGLWNKWVKYPRFEKHVRAFQQLRKQTPELTELTTYRGLLHTHSYWSHDSEGTLASILPAAKATGIEFIFLSDHPRSNADTIPRGYKGYYDGVLIEPGSEKHGFCAWPLDTTVIDWSVNRDTVVKNVVTRGGMFFYAHSEEDHNWSNPYYQGMEIYNIHTDTKDESLTPHIFNFLVNGHTYRHWALRELFDEQTSILALWDSLNQHRKIIGFSAVDAHENQNFRARYLKDGRVEWLGPNAKPIDTVEVTFWNRWLFDPPDEEGWIFKLVLDTYQTSFNHVMNYVVADTLSVASLAHHIKRGNLFIAFQSLGDAKGFLFYSTDRKGGVSAILGDSVRLDDVRSLHAVSPLPGEFRLVRDGETIDVSGKEAYEYKSTEAIETGVYRIEVHVRIDGEDLPWIYSNPIYVY